MCCHYCRRGLGKHNPACPESMPIDSQRRMLWDRGQSDGRRGQPSNSSDPAYSLGYDQGIIAIEEAANGFNPVIEGRQW